MLARVTNVPAIAGRAWSVENYARKHVGRHYHSHFISSFDLVWITHVEVSLSVEAVSSFASCCHRRSLRLVYLIRTRSDGVRGQNYLSGLSDDLARRD